MSTCMSYLDGIYILVCTIWIVYAYLDSIFNILSDEWRAGLQVTGMPSLVKAVVVFNKHNSTYLSYTIWIV